MPPARKAVAAATVRSVSAERHQQCMAAELVLSHDAGPKIGII